MIQITPIFTASPLRNFSYLVHSDRTGEAVCIDPYYPEQIINLLKKKGLKLKSILNTHEHSDHTAGNLELKTYTNCQIFGHKNTRGKIPGLDEILGEGDICFSVENETLVSWETPGHTDCHLTFAVTSAHSTKAVFTGDTIFNAGVGNCYRGGNPHTLFQTVKHRFVDLDHNTKLYPGHEYWENNLAFAKSIDSDNLEINHLLSSLPDVNSKEGFYVSDFGLEKKINPFFRLDNPHIQKQIRTRIKNESPSTEESYFVALRKLRDQW
ncbi:hydroxyacylglutathione hydrolase [Leptospira sp. 96542]|nr:hydroxyacylglutathione hydrolase [Leptospira sp. 96542]